MVAETACGGSETIFFSTLIQAIIGCYLETRFYSIMLASYLR